MWVSQRDPPISTTASTLKAWFTNISTNHVSLLLWLHIGFPVLCENMMVVIWNCWCSLGGILSYTETMKGMLVRKKSPLMLQILAFKPRNPEETDDRTSVTGRPHGTTLVRMTCQRWHFIPPHSHKWHYVVWFKMGLSAHSKCLREKPEGGKAASHPPLAIMKGLEQGRQLRFSLGTSSPTCLHEMPVQPNGGVEEEVGFMLTGKESRGRGWDVADLNWALWKTLSNEKLWELTNSFPLMVV